MNRWLSLPTSLKDIDTELEARRVSRHELPEHLAHIRWATSEEREEIRALVAAGGPSASVEGPGGVLQRRWVRRRESGCLHPGYWVIETGDVDPGNLRCVAGAVGCCCADELVDGDEEVTWTMLWRAHNATFAAVDDAVEIASDDPEASEVSPSPLVGRMVSAPDRESAVASGLSSGTRVARRSMVGGRELDHRLERVTGLPVIVAKRIPGRAESR